MSWHLSSSYSIESGTQYRFIHGRISLLENFESLGRLPALSLGSPFLAIALTISTIVVERRSSRSVSRGHRSWGLSFSLERAGCGDYPDVMMPTGLDIKVSLREVALNTWNNAHDSSSGCHAKVSLGESSLSCIWPQVMSIEAMSHSKKHIRRLSPYRSSRRIIYCPKSLDPGSRTSRFCMPVDMHIPCNRLTFVPTGALTFLPNLLTRPLPRWPSV